MKQVVFAVLLMAMASLTGCLNGDDSPVDENIDTTDDSTSDTTEDNSDTTDDTKDDELIEPVGTDGGYTPPENSNIRVDYGVTGQWEYDEGSDEGPVWVPCTKQGWTFIGIVSSEREYCDLDNRNDAGPQVWMNKTGNSVTVECIQYYEVERDACKDGYVGSYSQSSYGAIILFTNVEGFQEKTFVILSASYKVYGQDGEGDEVTHEFFKTKIDLAFEPASFTIMKTYSQYGSDGGAGSGYEKIYEQGQFDVSTRYF